MRPPVNVLCCSALLAAASLVTGCDNNPLRVVDDTFVANGFSRVEGLVLRADGTPADSATVQILVDGSGLDSYPGSAPALTSGDGRFTKSIERNDQRVERHDTITAMVVVRDNKMLADPHYSAPRDTFALLLRFSGSRPGPVVNVQLVLQQAGN